MYAYGASIDSIQLRGLGQELERSSRVPADFVWVEVDLGVYDTVDDADLAGGNWVPPRESMDSEVTHETLDDGRVAVTAGYWAPAEEKPKEKRGWLLALGAGAAALALIGIGLAVMESQK